MAFKYYFFQYNDYFLKNWPNPKIFLLKSFSIFFLKNIAVVIKNIVNF